MFCWRGVIPNVIPDSILTPSLRIRICRPRHAQETSAHDPPRPPPNTTGPQKSPTRSPPWDSPSPARSRCATPPVGPPAAAATPTPPGHTAPTPAGPARSPARPSPGASAPNSMPNTNPGSRPTGAYGNSWANSKPSPWRSSRANYARQQARNEKHTPSRASGSMSPRYALNEPASASTQDRPDDKSQHHGDHLGADHDARHIQGRLPGHRTMLDDEDAGGFRVESPTPGATALFRGGTGATATAPVAAN